jgi:TetR/AcrR family transcriptional repressor of nem operon
LTDWSITILNLICENLIMARPREFDEGRVIEALTRVFWEKGYEATSMQDLVKATGLLKGSLYGAFGDKKVLDMKALAHYDETHIQSAVDMLSSNACIEEKIGNLFNAVIEGVQKGVFAGGCLLCNASMEMATVDEAVQDSVKKTIFRMREAVTVALKSKIDSTDEAEALSNSIISSYFGARVLAKAGAPVQMIIDAQAASLKALATS